MNELAHSIQLLYEPDASPVIAVSGGSILFFNSAARRLFPSIEAGLRASALLPGAFLSCDEEVFVVTARTDRHALVANGVWYGGMLLLRIHLAPEEVTLSAEYMTINLRTELAAVRLALEQLSSSENTDPAALSVLHGGYYKLLRCCDNLSLAEQLAQNKCVFRPVPLDMGEWLEKIMSAAAAAAAVRGITLKCKIGGDIPIMRADPALLEQLLLNLLSNSIRHSAPGDSVQVRLAKQGPQLLLAVEDRGSGIPADQLGCLFNQQLGLPSLHLDSHKSLGLFVACGVAALHNGSITAANRGKGGIAVVVRLPVKNDTYLPLNTPQQSFGGRDTLEKRVRTGLADALE